MWHCLIGCPLRKLILHRNSVNFGMLTFSFLWKTIVSLWKRRRKIENGTTVFKNYQFFKKFVLKWSFLIKLVVSLTIVNDDPSLTIVNDYTSVTTVKMIVNKLFFSTVIVFKKQSYKNGHKSFYKNDRFQKRLKPYLWCNFKIRCSIVIVSSGTQRYVNKDRKKYSLSAENS